MWCVNVHGPDDVYAMPDKASALERANDLNVYFGSLAHGEHAPIMRAVVIEWPHNAESFHRALSTAKDSPLPEARQPNNPESA
jgi:hypothetical protein